MVRVLPRRRFPAAPPLTPRRRSNEIGAAGAEAVAALCIRGAALRRVSLAHNRVHDDGARAIAAALQSNVPLES